LSVLPAHAMFRAGVVDHGQLERRLLSLDHRCVAPPVGRRQTRRGGDAAVAGTIPIVALRRGVASRVPLPPDALCTARRNVSLSSVAAADADGPDWKLPGGTDPAIANILHRSLSPPRR